MTDGHESSSRVEQNSRRRSPSRSPPRKTQNKVFTGLKWKSKHSAAVTADRDDDDSSRRDRDRHRAAPYYPRRQRSRSQSPRRDSDVSDRRCERRGDRDGSREARPPIRDLNEKQTHKKEKAAAASADGEEMIIVHVNDRLGTKAAIPCFGSDPVGAFKVMVAARIGREPHQILLKRQGERPFKDHITLADYGVSNGVQLDLEVDTGD